MKNKENIDLNNFYITMGFDLWNEDEEFTVWYKNHRCVTFKTFDKAHEFLIMCISGTARIMSVMEGEPHEEN